MSKDWEYAKMAEDAKKHGGPDRYAKDLYEDGKNAGRSEMQTIIGIGGAICTAITAVMAVAGYLVGGYHERKKQQLALKTKADKAKLISSLKEVGDEPETDETNDDM